MGILDVRGSSSSHSACFPWVWEAAEIQTRATIHTKGTTAELVLSEESCLERDIVLLLWGYGGLPKPRVQLQVLGQSSAWK